MAEIRLLGADRAYRLDCANTNALAGLEEVTGLTLPALIRALARPEPDLELVKAFLGAVLIDPAEHTPEFVAAILEDIGGAPVVAAAAASVRVTL